MSELNYKASNISKAEQALKMNFFETLQGLGEGTPSFTSLLMILRAGGLSEQEADDMLDSRGITEALKDAVEALGKAGFLAKMGINLTEAQKQAVSESHDKIKSHVASRSTGSETKA